MALRLVYLIFLRLIGWIALSARTAAWKDAEVFATPLSAPTRMPWLKGQRRTYAANEVIWIDRVVGELGAVLG